MPNVSAAPHLKAQGGAAIQRLDDQDEFTSLRVEGPSGSNRVRRGQQQW